MGEGFAYACCARWLQDAPFDRWMEWLDGGNPIMPRKWFIHLMRTKYQDG